MSIIYLISAGILIFYAISGRINQDAVPAVMSQEYQNSNNKSVSSNNRLGPRTFRFGLSNKDMNEPVSNFHSEPPLNRRAVHFNGALNHENSETAHSSGDLRKKLLPSLAHIGINKKRNSGNSGSSGSDGYDQNGVLRISAPFLNNPLVQHLN